MTAATATHVTIGEPANESTTRKQSEPTATRATLINILRIVTRDGRIIVINVKVNSKDWMDTETIVAAAMSSESFSP